MGGRHDGTPGSYTLQGELMKRVYELVDIVDIKTAGQLRNRKTIPKLPLVRACMNMAIGDTFRCIPDVLLAIVRDVEVPQICTLECGSFVILLFVFIAGDYHHWS